MKFNYDLYRPKKVIKDAWKANSAYFRSKDVQVTPLTKIGDADEVYKSQSSGRIPALASKFKPKNRLVLSEILPRRRKISVRSADQQKRVQVRVGSPVSAFTKHLATLPAKNSTKRQLVARATDAGKEVVAVLQRNWQARRAVMSQLLLAVMVIGAGAGSVHAYIIRSHAPHPDSSKQTTSQTSVQPGTPPDTEKHTQEAPSAPPEPPAAAPPTPPTDPQISASTADETYSAQPSIPNSPASVVPSSPNPAPAPTSTPSTTAPPAPTPPAPSTPPPTTSDPSATPTSPPPENTTPPSDGTQSPPAPAEPTQTSTSDTKTNTQVSPSTQPDSSNTSPPGKDRKSSTSSN